MWLLSRIKINGYRVKYTSRNRNWSRWAWAKKYWQGLAEKLPANPHKSPRYHQGRTERPIEPLSLIGPVANRWVTPKGVFLNMTPLVLDNLLDHSLRCAGSYWKSPELPPITKWCLSFTTVRKAMKNWRHILSYVWPDSWLMIALDAIALNLKRFSERAHCSKLCFYFYLDVCILFPFHLFLCFWLSLSVCQPLIPPTLFLRQRTRAPRKEMGGGGRMGQKRRVLKWLLDVHSSANVNGSQLEMLHWFVDRRELEHIQTFNGGITLPPPICPAFYLGTCIYFYVSFYYFCFIFVIVEMPHSVGGVEEISVFHPRLSYYFRPPPSRDEASYLTYLNLSSQTWNAMLEYLSFPSILKTCRCKWISIDSTWDTWQFHWIYAISSFEALLVCNSNQIELLLQENKMVGNKYERTWRWWLNTVVFRWFM